MVEKVTKNGQESDRLATRRSITLVVDDEHELADVTAQLLAYHGFDALVAYSAHAALELMEARNDIDAIFSDVIMPFMTGLELAEVVARDYPAVRIVLASGFTAPAVWERTGRRYRFAKKPYSVDTVIQLLRQ